jgi:hypothetical protein
MTVEEALIVVTCDLVRAARFEPAAEDVVQRAHEILRLARGEIINRELDAATPT